MYALTNAEDGLKTLGSHAKVDLVRVRDEAPYHVSPLITHA